MRRFIHRFISLSIPVTLVATTACSAYKLKDPPPGFAEVEAWDGYTRLKSGDDVGINISSFHNVKGGTLAFWSEDLVEKLGKRGYQLQRQTPTKSKNGVVGTRFDFHYETPTEGHQKFYTAVLFVSDRQRVVVQMAGGSELADKYVKHTDELVRDIVVRGCRGKEICHGAQPGALSTAPAAKSAGDPEPGEEPAKAAPEEPEEPAPSDDDKPSG
jgi:hypothetical protein